MNEQGANRSNTDAILPTPLTSLQPTLTLDLQPGRSKHPGRVDCYCAPAWSEGLAARSGPSNDSEKGGVKGEG